MPRFDFEECLKYKFPHTLTRALLSALYMCGRIGPLQDPNKNSAVRLLFSLWLNSDCRVPQRGHVLTIFTISEPLFLAGNPQSKNKHYSGFHKLKLIKDFQEFQQTFSRKNYHTERALNGLEESLRNKSVELSKISEEKREDETSKKHLQKVGQVVDKSEFSNTGAHLRFTDPKYLQAQNSHEISQTIEETNEEGEKEKEQTRFRKCSRHSLQNNSGCNSPRIKLPKGDELDLMEKKKNLLEETQPPETIIEEKQEVEKQDQITTFARKSLENGKQALSARRESPYQLSSREITQLRMYVILLGAGSAATAAVAAGKGAFRSQGPRLKLLNR